MAKRTDYQKRRIYWKAVNRSRSRFVRTITRVWKKSLTKYLDGEYLAIQEAMQITYIEVGGKFARTQRNQLIRTQEKALGDINDDVDQLMSSYVSNELSNSTKSIQDTTTRLYAGIIGSEALTDAEKLREVERMIVARARFLAEQEVIRASNYGQTLGVELAQQFAAEQGRQVMYAKTWVATIDAVVRDAHADADGQTVRQPEYFIVGGEQLFYPKDPGGSPDNTINCRCTSIVNEIKESN